MDSETLKSDPTSDTEIGQAISIVEPTRIQSADKDANQGGRPTDFDPSFCEKLIEFFDQEPYDKDVSEESIEYFQNGAIKKKSVKLRLTANKLPTLFGFSRKIGVVYSTVWRWMKKGEDLIGELEKENPEITEEALTDEQRGYVEFCNAYKAAKELQKEFLISLGLSGAAPAPAFIFTAKNVTDMRDTGHLDLSTLGDKLGNNTVVIREMGSDAADS